jgi:hypothetical protein
LEIDPVSNNPYQAPQSKQLTDVPFSDEHVFYVVSKRKFAVLFIATFGFYGLYWVIKTDRATSLHPTKK